MAAALSLAGFWIALASLLARFCIACLAINSADNGLRLLRRYSHTHPFSPNLGRTLAELSATAGLDLKNLPIVDFNVTEAVREQQDKDPKRKKYANKFVLNAAAGYSGQDYIMVSEPLLKVLGDAEEKAILGHEFAHLIHHHARIGICRRFLAGVTRLACFGLVAREIAQNCPHGAAVAAAAAAVAILATRRSVNLWLKILAILAALLSLFYLDPTLKTICAEAFGLYILASLCNTAGSRNGEYEADQGAIALKASPLALVTGLRKLDFYEAQERCRKLNKPRPEKPEPLKEDGTIVGFFEFFGSHPTTTKRALQLCAAASTMGFPESDILAAFSGDIPVSGEYEISDEFVSKYTGSI